MWQREKKTRSDKRKCKSSQPWDPRRTLNGLRSLGILAAVVGVVVAWQYGERWLMRYAQITASNPISKIDIVLSQVPPWLSPVLQDRFRRAVAHEVGVDARLAGLERAVRWLAVDPWVKQVSEVRRTGRDTVAVAARYREPRAMVQGTGGCYLLDAQGVRLPDLYVQPQLDQPSLPVIAGMSSGPPPVGEVWPGEDLQAGLSLASLLSGQPYVHQIRAIDVSPRDARGRIRLALVTRNGTVWWGFAPGDEQAIEPGVETKLHRLAQVYQQRGSIDAGDKIVDVSGPAVFVHSASTSALSRHPSAWNRR